MYYLGAFFVLCILAVLILDRTSLSMRKKNAVYMALVAMALLLLVWLVFGSTQLLPRGD